MPFQTRQDIITENRILGDCLRILRHAKHVSLETIEAAGIPRHQVVLLEKGKVTDRELADKYGKLLGVNDKEGAFKEASKIILSCRSNTTDSHVANLAQDILPPLSVMIMELRESGNETQTEFANRSRVSRASVNLIEAGKGNPRMDTLQRIAEALGAENSVNPVSAIAKLYVGKELHLKQKVQRKV